MASRAYKDAALAAAVSQHMTAATAATLTYQQVAALCGVVIDAKTGNSPADFFYVPIRTYLTNTLKQQEADAALAADKAAIEAAVKALPAYKDAKVSVVDGEIKVETPNTKPTTASVAEVP